MNKKLLDDANAAGFDVAYGQVTLNGRASDTVLNYKLAKFAALQQQNSVEKETALEKYNALIDDLSEPDPIERLRFFLSLSLKGQDWLDVEKFIDDLQMIPAST